METAIVIPTLNRPEYVLRQVQYYLASSFPVAIYIGDSSTGANAEVLQNGLERLGSQDRVSYNHWPEKNDFQTIRDLLGLVTQKYVTYSGDDDIHFISTIKVAQEFLTDHPEYAYARGEAIGFHLEADGPFGSIAGTFPYQQFENEGVTASSRLVNFFQNYNVTLFSVQHTENLRDSFQSMPDSGIHRSMTEILPCARAAIAGKGKVLRGHPGFLRQVMAVKYAMPGTFDMVLDRKWFESAECFIQILARDLENLDGIEPDVAVEQARNGLARYVYGSLSKKFAFREDRKTPSPAKGIPRILNALKRRLQSFAPLEKKHTILEELTEVQRIYQFLETGNLLSESQAVEI